LTGSWQAYTILGAEVALIYFCPSLSIGGVLGEVVASGEAGVLWLCTEQCAGAVRAMGLVCLEANRRPLRFACC
jgi:hypothetical protein